MECDEQCTNSLIRPGWRHSQHRSYTASAIDTLRGSWACSVLPTGGLMRWRPYIIRHHPPAHPTPSSAPASLRCPAKPFPTFLLEGPLVLLLSPMASRPSFPFP